MKYSYKCDVRPFDLWKLAMIRTYKSPAGIVNIIFTLSMVLLTIKFLPTSSDLAGAAMLLGCSIFPVLQPLAVYMQSVKQLEDLPKSLELAFDDKAMHVTAGQSKQDIVYKKITNAIRQKNMIVIMSDDRHGYMLTDRVLGNEKDEFYSFLCGRITA